MIRTLLRELRRSQGFPARGALVLVLFAVELASFTMVSVSTRAAEQSRADHAQGTDREHMAFVGAWTNGPGVERGSGNGIAEPEALAKLSADIHTADPRVFAWEQFYPSIVGLRGRYMFNAVDPLSPLALAEGRAPDQGEVAISRQIATELGIGVGDELSLTAERDVPGADLTLTVTGILREPSSDAVEYNMGSAVVSLEDAGALAVSTGSFAELNADGAVTAVLFRVFWWDGSVPASAAPYIASDEGGDFGGAPSGYRIKGAEEVLTTSLAVLFAVATLVAAGLAARNQVQSRSRWVGTVRELGAKRRQVAAAALIEASITGGAVAVLGGVMGWATNAVLLAHTNTNTPATFLPSTAPYPAWALGATLLLSLLLAAALSLVPAYWAARALPGERSSEALEPAERIATTEGAP
ncbi:FtsX-like permease family protein [Demequina lutea]|uniref:Putative lysophospholipase L1 biosynthesis ABC-type transport system permease subunit n=1 Tax=Demequina lutea TaxID=431489 RepID=A0A7Y9Z7C9_9MICO|nr:ABC transporter permease [Demequina lutea]NYI40162.1 putative lysophospholipase L1 biosynthesis ABC-type transport system permease subunit [Demequina lutea]